MSKRYPPPDEPNLNEDAEGLIKRRVTRRTFLKGVGGTAVTAAMLPTVKSTTAAVQTPIKGISVGTVTLTVNGERRTVSNVEARTTLLELLRNRLGITGPKPICERASCGGCTVFVDGLPIYSCSTLAMDVEGKEITTIEGLAEGDRLHPVQEAFIEKDAMMCGFCTPGFVMSVTALLKENPNPTLEEVKEAVSGNLCRCGTYPRIFEAALAAAERMRKGA